MPSKVLNLHFRILEQPLFKHPNGTKEMLDRVKALFAQANVDIEIKLLSEKVVTTLPQFRTVSINNACPMLNPTQSQKDLLSHRDEATSEKDVFIWFIQATTPASHGCAAHEPGKPGAVIASAAPGWTLAHEIGHLLSLIHELDNKKHLMFESVNKIVLTATGDLPDLENEDVSVMEASRDTLLDA
jgi:hypothetical protein